MDALQKTMCDTVFWDNGWSACYTFNLSLEVIFVQTHTAMGLFIDLLPATCLSGGAANALFCWDKWQDRKSMSDYSLPSWSECTYSKAVCCWRTVWWALIMRIIEMIKLILIMSNLFIYNWKGCESKLRFLSIFTQLLLFFMHHKMIIFKEYLSSS